MIILTIMMFIVCVLLIVSVIIDLFGQITINKIYFNKGPHYLSKEVSLEKALRLTAEKPSGWRIKYDAELENIFIRKSLFLFGGYSRGVIKLCKSKQVAEIIVRFPISWIFMLFFVILWSLMVIISNSFSAASIMVALRSVGLIGLILLFFVFIEKRIWHNTLIKQLNSSKSYMEESA